MAAKPLTKSQIIEKLADRDETLTKKNVKEVLDGLAELAYAEAKKGFTVPGIGKLVVVKRKARKGRNPQTGEAIKIPARTALKFRISKAAKDATVGTAAKKTAKKTTKKKSAKKKTSKKR
jgi:DNA-binding protein HU-beta